MAVCGSGWKCSNGSMNSVKFFSRIKSRIKIKVLTAVTRCVTSVTVIKSGFGSWFIDENSIIC